MLSTRPTCEEPLQLRCGLKLPNRLVKAAVSENLSTHQGLPNNKYANVYEKWAEGGWGMIITGNVQVDDRYLGTSTDLFVPSQLDDDTVIKAWSGLAAICSKDGTPAVMQLNHPGRQCPIGAGKHAMLAKNLAPSPVGLHMGPGFIPSMLSKVAFGAPRQLTCIEIESIVAKFVKAAALAAKSGFAGIEIHASHGYLLDQFLSPYTNHRHDAYGGSPRKRAKLTTDIICGIRNATPPNFCVGLLVSAADPSGLCSDRDTLEALEAMLDTKPDYLHVSGGTFEKPTMFLGPDLDDKISAIRTPFYVEQAAEIRKRYPDVPVIVTGGFRDRISIQAAVQSGKCDMVGVARPAAVEPHLPSSVILNSNISDTDAQFHQLRVDAPWIVRQIGVTALNVHMDNAWYLSCLKRLSYPKLSPQVINSTKKQI